MGYFASLAKFTLASKPNSRIKSDKFSLLISAKAIRGRISQQHGHKSKGSRTNLNDVVALVVEGVPKVADTLLTALVEDDVLCDVVVTRDGTDTLDYLFGRGAYAGWNTEVMPRVIFLDLVLPDSSALDVLWALRNNNRTRLVPIVAFSSSAERPDPNTVYSLGVNSYIRNESEPFAESLRHAALYWLLLNEPPPTLHT